jgi:hypothetical protein
MRLSVSVSNAPEKMLLNPRVTTLLCTRPVLAKSTPGWSRTNSDTLRTDRVSISFDSTTEIDAGASRAFSCVRDAETTRCSRLRTAPSRVMSRLAPAAPNSTRRVCAWKPMWVTATS